MALLLDLVDVAEDTGRYTMYVVDNDANVSFIVGDLGLV